MASALYILTLCFALDLGSELKKESQRLSNNIFLITGDSINDNHKVIANISQRMNKEVMKQKLSEFTMVRKKTFYNTPPFHMDIKRDITIFTTQVETITELPNNEEDNGDKVDSDIAVDHNLENYGEIVDRENEIEVEYHQTDDVPRLLIDAYKRYDENTIYRNTNSVKSLDYAITPNIKSHDSDGSRNSNATYLHDEVIRLIDKQNKLVRALAERYENMLVQQEKYTEDYEFDKLLRSLNESKLRKANNKKAPATIKATSKKKSATTTKKAAATTKKNAATANKKAITTTKKNSPTTKKNAATTKKKAANTKKNSPTTKKNAATTKKKAATTKKNSATTKQKAVITKKNAVATKKNAAATKKTTTTTKAATTTKTTAKKKLKAMIATTTTEKTTTTTEKERLIKVVSMFDETLIKNALKADPFVQRILKMAQKKKEQYFKRAKIEAERN